MAPRKVAYLTPLYFDERSCLGGGERYPLNLARGVVLAAGGRYVVELISFGDEPRRLALAPGVSLRVLPAARRPRNPLDVVSWDLPDALAEADLVHIHQAYTRCTEMGLLVAKQLRRPICLTDHGGHTSTLGAEVGSLDLVDCLIAQSEFTLSAFQPSGARIVLVKGGVDGDLFTPPPDPVPRDRVLFVGRLLPHKGIDRLISALPPELPLTVCGRPHREDYFRYLQALSADKLVEFITDADDEAIRRLYWRAWANILPSVYRDCYGNTYTHPELMGLTLLEAMACGTPAIGSRVGGIPEFIRHGETGFLFDEPTELAEQLRLLASHPELVEQMGRQARRIVEQEYDLKVCGAKLVAIYDGLIREAVGVAA
ncbi:MAG: glycosyltransferase family 4 protein [Isosphaeraceae bacterium]|nr:glycosyltransferase family 4 protein [Isosphaeraceae bacterium]